MIDLGILEQLNAPEKDARLKALERVLENTRFIPMDARMINNHIHTTYSFSPYSPSAAVYASRSEGLCTCGIVDHDTIGGAREFIEAGRLAGIPTTIGIETRVTMAGTAFERLRTNNPDQTGVSYMALHGVPHGNIDKIQAFFAPIRERRNARNRAMVRRINEVAGVSLDFERDVVPLSMHRDGGTVTERHLMLALARALIASGREKPNRDGPWFEYDLVARLKKEFIPKVYIPATDECPSLADIVLFSKKVDGVLCYAYLGDVTDSVTGDKRAQKFEDDNLDQLFDTLREYGVRAVTYMPTRNTHEQLERLRGLCQRYGMAEISGEDINSPYQRFVIETMKDERFSNLIDTTWALIRHEAGEEWKI
jgi:hypothetical protein